MFVILAMACIGILVLLLAFVLAIYARVKGKLVGFARFLTFLALFGCLIPLCAGLCGKSQGISNMEEALEAADSEYREEMEAAGRRFAAIPMKFGGCTTLAFLFPAFVVFIIVPRRKRGWEDALDD